MLAGDVGSQPVPYTPLSARPSVSKPSIRLVYLVQPLQMYVYLGTLAANSTLSNQPCLLFLPFCVSTSKHAVQGTPLDSETRFGSAILGLGGL